MRSKLTIGALAVVTALLTITLGTGAAFAQGKDRGGDRGGSKGQTQSKGQPQRVERQQTQRQQPQRIERPQPQRQPQQQRQQAQRQQPQRIVRQQTQQPRMNTGLQTQGRQNNGRARIEQQGSQAGNRPVQGRVEQRRTDRSTSSGIRLADQARYRPQGGNDIGGNGRSRQQQVQTNNAGPNNYGNGNALSNNYGYLRSQTVHARNADRRALMNENRFTGGDLGNDNWFAYRYDEAPNYIYGRYSYQNHQRWNDVLRNVVANMLGSNAGYYDNYYPQYQSISYGDPYYQAYYGGNYYNGYPQYQNYAYDPYYQDNYGYGNGYDPQYYGADYYPDNGGGYMSAGIVISFGGFGRQMSGQLLTVGYDQGYNDGSYATNAGYGDRYYNDPYIYEDAMYDPYSYSLGENRRVLSDGYELGYTDAQNNGRYYDRYQNGSVDLVSVLIGSSLTIL